MGQQLRTWQVKPWQVKPWQVKPWKSADSQRMWLSALIAAMEEVSRPELRGVPCDSHELAALRAQLMRPASSHLTYTSPYSLRN